MVRGPRSGFAYNSTISNIRIIALSRRSDLCPVQSLVDYISHRVFRRAPCFVQSTADMYKGKFSVKFYRLFLTIVG